MCQIPCKRPLNVRGKPIYTWSITSSLAKIAICCFGFDPLFLGAKILQLNLLSDLATVLKAISLAEK